MAYDVFISYSSLDKQIADAVCSTLENNKIRCWIAPRDILPGDTYGRAIIAAINDCKIVIIVFSSSSDSSGQVINEIERAVSKGKIIIPFRIENIKPSGDMELFLGRRHWLDAMTPPLESHIARLTDTIFKLIQIPTESHKPRLEPSESKVGLKVKDSSDNETILTEYGVVYNLYAEKILSNSIRTHLIIERGSSTQEIPWAQIEKVDIQNMERAKITFLDSKTLDPVKLRSGRLVGMDESGFAVVLDLANIHSINPLRVKVVVKETTTISRTESLSNKTNSNLAPGNLPDSKTQLSWFMKTTTGPEKRSCFGMIYDLQGDVILLNGGYGLEKKGMFNNPTFGLPNSALGDTWIWNGSFWKLIENNQLRISRHAIAFDRNLNNVVISGGEIRFDSKLEETYRWSGNEWINADVNKEYCPSMSGSNQAMAFDEKRNSIILFVNKFTYSFYNGPNNIGETWEWNGLIWSLLQVDGSEPRWGHKMVYDENTGKILLYGGQGSKNELFDDTWLWNGTTATWSKVNTSNSPLARSNHAMTYDSMRKKVLLFGGKTESDVPLNDLWEWDGSDWKLLMEHAPPKPRYDHGLVYDKKRNKTILFGGYDGKDYFQDTWEFTY
jgi:hypothetical protein